MNRGDYYRSNPFSASGWRFAECYFQTNGARLKWRSYVDDGRVGDRGDAWSQYRVGTSASYGVPLYVSSGYQYITGDNNMTTYYTYNPKNGTYYTVENN
ncbi:MAG: hypothetical protein LBM95_08955 [Lactobacillales bacterium]|jgi:hypothetical protein|nr:hypothetical protein [Lactobacillales bacterium]